MKKLIIASLCAACFTTAAAAATTYTTMNQSDATNPNGSSTTGTTDHPVTSATWDAVVSSDNKSVTYNTSISGNFKIDLGEVAIRNGESFILSMTLTTPAWGNKWGIGVLSTGSPYYEYERYDDEFRVYVGHPTENNGVCFSANMYPYMPTSTYSDSLTEISVTNPMTLSFTFQYMNDADTIAAGDRAERPEDGGHNGRFIFKSNAGSDVTIAQVVDENVWMPFNFSELCNYGVASDDLVYGVPLDAVTTISITKSMPIPEPATSTLSLLALAGLVARRRRG